MDGPLRPISKAWRSVAMTPKVYLVTGDQFPSLKNQTMAPWSSQADLLFSHGLC